MFAKSKSTLKPKKKKVSFSDIVEFVPDESPMKDIKVKPQKSDARADSPSTDSNSEGENNVPITLAYLDDYLEKNQNKQKQVEKMRGKVEKFFKDMISNSELCMQVPAKENIISNIKSGHFKNSFETKTKSNLGDYDSARKDAVSLSFGVPKDVVEDMLNKNEAYKFEKYGYLGAESKENVLHYGEIQFKFKKEQLLNKTTITVGDSLNNDHVGVVASRLTNPKVESIPGVINGDGSLLVDTYKLIDGKDITPDMDPMDIAQEIQNCAYLYMDVADIPYFELQFHGDLKMKDVESCELPAYTSQVKKKVIKGAGVPVKEI